MRALPCAVISRSISRFARDLRHRDADLDGGPAENGVPARPLCDFSRKPEPRSPISRSPAPGRICLRTEIYELGPTARWWRIDFIRRRSATPFLRLGKSCGIGFGRGHALCGGGEADRLESVSIPPIGCQCPRSRGRRTPLRGPRAVSLQLQQQESRPQPRRFRRGSAALVKPAVTAESCLRQRATSWSRTPRSGACWN